MELSNSVLGTYLVNQLRERVKAPLLRIGCDNFSRRDFARVECFNFTAAANLDYLVNKHLKVKDTHDLYMNHNPGELALPRMGSISLATLSAAFEAKGLGGESPLEAWLRRHDVKIATWGTMRDRENEEIRQEKRRLRERKHSRRNQAHSMRLVRYAAKAS